jgi:molybdopterin molybdotransferase
MKLIADRRGHVGPTQRHRESPEAKPTFFSVPAAPWSCMLVGMLTPAEAEKLILEHVPLFHEEDCPLASAHGRVLRRNLCADRDLPPFDRVTMDGYALRAAELASGEKRFQVEGVQAAGMRPFQLSAAAGECIEIMTGAVLPSGADCVVPSEETTRDGDAVIPSATAVRLTAGHAIHRRGSDQRAGGVIVHAGTRLTGRAIAVAAACGYATLTVSQQPKIAIVATGDELVEVDAPVAAHQIRRSNDYALRAALALAGWPLAERFHLRDVRHEIEHVLWHILAEFDVVLIAGGISKGKFDFLPAELDRQKVTKIFQGVAQRPGKPFWFGISSRQTPVFALPGNPVSAYTCLHRYVLPALAHAAGLALESPPLVALAEPVAWKAPLAYFLPVKLAPGPRGERRALPAPSNTSGDFTGLIDSDGFVELPAGPAEVAAGTLVPFRAWL